MHRPPGPPPQRPLSMNPLNFNRVASNQGVGANTAGAPSPSAYNYLPRPSPGANSTAAGSTGAAATGANSGASSTPFNRGFPFGASNLPPHLAGFAASGASALQQQHQQHQQQQHAASGQQGASVNAASLNMNEFPALGGSFSSTPAGGNGQNSGGGGGNGGGVMSYANSTAGGNRGGVAAGGAGTDLNTDDFPALNDGFGGANGSVGLAEAAAAAANQEQASAAATLQHQRLAREQNQSQTLNAARGGFGEPDRNYATKVGMQQPPGMSSAQNWFSANFGGGAGGTGQAAGALGLNGFSQAAAAAAAAAAATGTNSSLDDIGSNAGQQAAAASLLLQQRNAPPRQSSAVGNAGQAGSSAPQHAKTPAQQVLTSPADRFGLAGLLNIIKMQDPDLSMLAMGSDLQTLGLNLNAQEALSSTFVTPWTDNAALAASMQQQVEPDFHLPSCYNVQAPPPPQSKIASFSDETLFFIFYSTPRDVLQEVAAQELYNRNWRFYRGGLNLWLTKEENVQPTHKDLRAEKGVYIFWDPATWSKVSREFVLAYDALEERSMGVSPAQLQQQQAAAAAAATGGQTPGQASSLQQQSNQTPATPHQQPQQQQQQHSAQIGA